MMEYSEPWFQRDDPVVLAHYELVGYVDYLEKIFYPTHELKVGAVTICDAIRYNAHCEECLKHFGDFMFGRHLTEKIYTLSAMFEVLLGEK